MKVEWDEAKNAANQRKHGVSFQEAQAIFNTRGESLDIFDEAHSEGEDRFISIGPIQSGLVVVVWVERDEETIRIISARWATRRELKLYEEYRGLNP